MSKGKHGESEIIRAFKKTMPNILGAIKHKWNTRIVGARKRMWDTLYAAGFGYQLSLPGEQAHNQTLVDFMVSANKNTTILDVGCGEGLLLDYLGCWGYQKYVGVDLSDVAVRNASKRANQNTSFVSALAESFVPDGQFDAIIFNECLYCFADPLQVIRRYERYLTPDGVILVSLFTKTERIKLIAAEISKGFRVMRKASVINGADTWECIMLGRASGPNLK
ncbi:MAG TPA: methyltransferase domain-containing protein [Terriglobales bacterium]|jgi:2-polyprenyl-3-methyl-5-hydroxy-6-metoxy-1,4-benzoquinol methylase|nr:methyltransferase domain-containing protein [Terriglobales bacterium]